MARGPIVEALAVNADSTELDADPMPLPTVDERANFYLQAVYGERRFTNEEHSGARDLILQAMADDIVARSKGRSPDDASLPFSEQHNGVTASADAFFLGTTQQTARDAQEAAPVVARKPRTFNPHTLLRGLPSIRLPSLQRLPSFRPLPRMAAVCGAAAIAAVAGYWVGGVTARFGPNTAANDPPSTVQSPSTAQVAPRDPGSGPPSGSGPRILAEMERELASALNTSQQLSANDITALITRGQELAAQGKFRLARVVLERAAEARSAAAALALGRTYDPLVDRSAIRGDAPPDVAMARAWYEKAKDLGSNEAAQRLTQLPASVPAPSTRTSPK